MKHTLIFILKVIFLHMMSQFLPMDLAAVYSWADGKGSKTLLKLCWTLLYFKGLDPGLIEFFWV